MKRLLEICVSSAESAIEAEKGGADRVELCENLQEGGTTPSIGMIELCAENIQIPIHVLIRPRPGDFCYSSLELEIMLRDIKRLRAIKGVSGFVIGALNEEGSIDKEMCKALMDACFPYSVTFHRAFDVCSDPKQALEDIIELGCHTLLSSGQAATALQGINLLKKLNTQAAGRIQIMPGSGINENNVNAFADAGFESLHMSLRTWKKSQMQFRSKDVKMSAIAGIDDCDYMICDQEKVKKVRAILDKNEKN